MKTKENKSNKFIKIVLLILIIFILLTLLFVGIGFKIVNSKLSKITFKDIDETKISINDKMYDEVSHLVSEKEFLNIHNILLIGSDSKEMEDTYAGNSDCQIIISINKNKKTVKLISVPRDTAVEIPEHGRNKINAAFAKGKEELTLKTFNTNFGLNLKEYVTINISGMYNVINKIGGIEVDITKAEMEYINKTSPMFYEFSGNKYKKLTGYGKVTLDGEQAATHAKDRMAGGNDFTRTRRQRDILMAIVDKLSKLSYSEILDASDLILENITTNVDISKYITMLPELYSNRNEYLNNITEVMIPDETYAKSVYEYIEGRRLYLFDPDLDKTKEELIKYIYEK